MNNLLRRAAALLLLVTTAALANPQLTPGLWEHRMAMKSNDPKLAQAMADAQRAMASMPPDQRKMMEQMMGQHGIGMPGAGGGSGVTINVCITPEQAARQELPPPDKSCTHRITARTGNSMKFVVECAGEQLRGEGEAVFTSSKAYDSRFRMQRNKDGTVETFENQVSARWLGADCGNLKPPK